MSQRPRVSVCIITFNHEDYIEQALLSALTQRTDFEFEVIVSDDASTDRTLEVIQRVAARYPKLRVIAHRSNIGGQENYLAVHNAAQGDYVAHLDGDDFWLPGKLKAQVTFMDAHPECSVTWHPLIVFDELGSHYIIGDHGKFLRSIFGKVYIDLSEAIIAYGMTGFHSSCMYRRSARTIFSYPRDRVLLDYRLSLSFLEKGSGFHLTRVLGCYRAFVAYSATRGVKDVVGPGLLTTLTDYVESHPNMVNLVAAHCVALVASRVTFQARMAGLLISRMRTNGHGEAPGGEQPTETAHISIKQRIRAQGEYSRNSLRLLWLAARQTSVPPLNAVRAALWVQTYQSRPKRTKSQFVDRLYGRQLATRKPESEVK